MRRARIRSPTAQAPPGDARTATSSNAPDPRGLGAMRRRAVRASRRSIRVLRHAHRPWSSKVARLGRDSRHADFAACDLWPGDHPMLCEHCIAGGIIFGLSNAMFEKSPSPTVPPTRRTSTTTA